MHQRITQAFTMKPLYCYWLAGLLTALSVGMLGLAGYGYFIALSGPALHAKQEEVEVPACAPGETREVTIRLENRSGRPIRVLGVGGC